VRAAHAAGVPTIRFDEGHPLRFDCPGHSPAATRERDARSASTSLDGGHLQPAWIARLVENGLGRYDPVT
jgi:hypothetical protein